MLEGLEKLQCASNENRRALCFGLANRLKDDTPARYRNGMLDKSVPYQGGSPAALDDAWDGAPRTRDYFNSRRC